MVPLPHDASISRKILVSITGLPTAAVAAESFPCGGVAVGGVGGGFAGTAAPPTPSPSAVQVSEDVIVDLTGDLLLLQHLFDRLTRCQCLNLLPLLTLLLLLQTHSGEFKLYSNYI